jgi:hypothetical protein
VNRLRALKQIGAVAGCSLFALFLIDSAAFRTGLYSKMVAPASYSGRFRAAIQGAAKVSPAGAKLVLVVGDSAMGEGFSARIADQTAGHRVRFVTGAVPAASIRTWFYLLRELDPQRNRFSVIVLPVEGYDDEDGPWDRDDNTNDMRLVVSALHIGDVVEFTRSFRKWDARWLAFRDVMLKGMVYRNDLRDFFSHPQQRLTEVQASEAHGSEWTYGYGGRNQDFDPASHEIQTMIHRPPSPQTGIYKEYRTYWLDKLVAPYARKGTKFLIVRAPRNPVPIARYARHDPRSSIRSLASRRNVVVADEHIFADLEQIPYFFDALHMNSAGRRLFSSRLAALVVERFF